MVLGSLNLQQKKLKIYYQKVIQGTTVSLHLFEAGTDEVFSLYKLTLN